MEETEDAYPPVIGALSDDAAATLLRDLGDHEAADLLSDPDLDGDGHRRTFGSGLRKLLPARAWAHTSHTFGFIPPGSPMGQAVDIQHAGTVAPDRSLAGSTVSVSLDRLHIADYPGWGTHHVLFDFHVSVETPGQESVGHHFSLTQRVRDGERAAVIGRPLFVELPVPASGIGLRCYTVNVKNEEDERLLGFLDSPAFRLGLRIGHAVHPAVGMVGKMAVGLTRAVAGRRRNVAVQDFQLGLGFSQVPTRAGLAEGSYVAVQIPESQALAWEWDEWRYYPATGHVAHTDDPSLLLPYNHLVLGIGRDGVGAV